MYDPLTLSQTQARASTGAAALLRAHKEDAKVNQVAAEAPPAEHTTTSVAQKAETLTGDPTTEKKEKTPEGAAMKK